MHSLINVSLFLPLPSFLRLLAEAWVIHSQPYHHNAPANLDLCFQCFFVCQALFWVLKYSSKLVDYYVDIASLLTLGYRSETDEQVNIHNKAPEHLKSIGMTKYLSVLALTWIVPSKSGI